MTHVSKAHSPGAVQQLGDALPALLTDDEIATVRVVKVDVESAEYDVVAGLADTIDRFPETCEFVIKVGPQRAVKPADVDALITTFEAAGYTPYALPTSMTRAPTCSSPWRLASRRFQCVRPARST